MAKGGAAAGTAMYSSEGGILPEEKAAAHSGTFPILIGGSRKPLGVRPMNIGELQKVSQIKNKSNALMKRLDLFAG